MPPLPPTPAQVASSVTAAQQYKVFTVPMMDARLKNRTCLFMWVKNVTRVGLDMVTHIAGAARALPFDMLLGRCQLLGGVASNGTHYMSDLAGLHWGGLLGSAGVNRRSVIQISAEGAQKKSCSSVGLCTCAC